MRAVPGRLFTPAAAPLVLGTALGLPPSTVAIEVVEGDPAPRVR